jgi:fumarylacetoacetase
VVAVSPTNDPALRSFVPVAADSHFPIQNLPFGIFRRRDGWPPGVGVAIGDFVLDLPLLEDRGLISTPGGPLFARPTLNAFLALGPSVWSAVRARISHLLREDEPSLRDDAELRSQALVPMADVEMSLPVAIGDYTDFYSSRHHAENVGTMLRGADNALMPNWLHLPVAYHGRASSVVVSGTDIRRPLGQTKGDNDPAPSFGPSRNLDFELEMGFFVGPGNTLGQPIPVTETGNHIFGLVLVNDWSARDVQKWEYQPLGPFLAKNFATSISPWVVPLEALRPFRVAGPKQEPAPLPYLRSDGNGAFDIQLEVALQTAALGQPHTICRSNARYLYWNIDQQLAHHTSNGCPIRPGDLMASGTISGPEPGSYGCMLELAWRGSKPLVLPNGETRSFLQDGDCVTMTGWCQGNGYRVGFGEVTGKVLAAAVS